MKHVYTNGIHHKCIALLGPLPPPLGGVSVHVERVISKLKDDNHVVHFDTCVEYRYRFFIIYLLRLIFFLFKYKPHELHLHTLYLSNGLRELEWIMRMKRLLRYDVILIEHDCRYMYKQSKQWKAQLNRLMPHIKKQVFIGNVTAQSYHDSGIVSARATSVESAFLPPAECNEQAILNDYPKGLFHFIDQHYPILLANAFQLSLLDGKDLYGFDQCLGAVRQIKEHYSDIGMIFALGQIGDDKYHKKLLNQIKQLGLEKHCFILIGQRPLWPLLKKIDLFLRPTLSDGASVSVEEALWLGKPVVASNVCHRPDGVVVYDVHDQDGLNNAITQVLHPAKSSLVKMHYTQT